MKARTKLSPGELYAIPLFVSDQPILTRFTKKDWDRPDARFAFMRVIEDRAGSGIVIEVLNRVGSLDTPSAEIVRAKRLFRPVTATRLAIEKKRWTPVGMHEGYDRERDSGYSEITLVLSPTHDPVLWKGGIKTPVSLEEASRHEPWTFWDPGELERRIIAALDAERKA
jgi:hypothetical protein